MVDVVNLGDCAAAANSGLSGNKSIHPPVSRLFHLRRLQWIEAI